MITAPYGDDSMVVDDVQVTNLSPSTLTLSHYEFWDVNRYVS
jgi:hypothetical protein